MGGGQSETSQSSSTAPQRQNSHPSAPPPYSDNTFKTDVDNANDGDDIYGDSTPMDVDPQPNLITLSDDDDDDDAFDSEHDSAAEDIDGDETNEPPQYHPLANPSNSQPTPTHQPTNRDTSRPFSPHSGRPLSPRPAPSSPTRLVGPARSGPARPNAWGKDTNVPRHLRPSSPAVEMCVICSIRPQFRNGAHSYPTCGNSCARKLKDLQNLPDQTVRGQMGNPHRTSSTRSSYSPGFTNNSYGTRSNQSYHSASTSKMCEVCRIRPRYQRGGKIYPTCGLTCAAKMHPPGTVEMCDYCKQRPKVVINGKTFPQCGRTCRDKAKAAASESRVNAASCTTCIVCWKAMAKPPNEDYCSKACEGVIRHRAPFLLEIPRGHVSFKSVADAFTNAWKHPKQPCPSVKKVYQICISPDHVVNYEDYALRVNAHALFRKKGNEQRRWMGIPRECGFGDPGNTTPCTSLRCLLCTVVRSKFDMKNFPEGIMTTSLARAVEISSNLKRRTSKVVLLTNVLLGKTITMVASELVDPLPPRGSDSVHLVGYKANGMKIDYDECMVYDGDAIRPLYLISYD